MAVNSLALVHHVSRRGPTCRFRAQPSSNDRQFPRSFFPSPDRDKGVPNELVRRFPKRPPPFLGPITTRILDMIHEWRETSCKESRWKVDLGNIEDMNRLLGYKRYRFSDSPQSGLQAQVSNAATADPESPEELEEEDRAAQSASHASTRKLENAGARLKGHVSRFDGCVKAHAVSSGCRMFINLGSKPDYKKQTLHELEKLRAKVVLLNELLDDLDASRGERLAKRDAYDVSI
ncbi:hypothetical protein FRC12_005123 [Ceratobasidium sp. 428]|nr:hypothetical protein FRC12_005123 [Ceratobasidium sp. 428]